jgi:hypothetical protein
MYNNLGIHWASSIPAFLALMCVPFPFLFYKYGQGIRMRCKFAAEAARELQEMQDGESDSVETAEEEDKDEERDEEKDAEKDAGQAAGNDPKSQ